MRATLALLSALALSAGVSGASLRCSPAGAGRACSAAAPCSLSEAVSQALQAADAPAVQLEDGAYEAVNLTLAAAAPLTLNGTAKAVLSPAAGADLCLSLDASAAVAVRGVSLHGCGIAFAAAAAGGASLELSGATVRDAAAGALRASGAANVTVHGCTFEKNGDKDLPQGGAVLARDGVALAVSASHFQENAAKEGGAVYVEASGGAEASFEGSTFVRNNASAADGGAVAVVSGKHGGKVSVHDVTCDTCLAGFGYGGCVSVRASAGDAVAVDLALLNATACRSSFGGGLSLRGDAPGLITGVVSNATLADNFAVAAGGAYVANVSAPSKAATPKMAVQFFGCSVTKNRGFSGPGGVWLLASAATFPASTLSENVIAQEAAFPNQTVLPRNATAAQAAMDEQLYCDDDSKALGSCAACPLTERRDFVIKGKDAKCDKCFKAYDLKHALPSGAVKGPYACVEFSAGKTRNATKDLEKYAVCVAAKDDGLDTCPVVGEDLSFGTADVVGLAALGVATLAIFNCLVGTRSPEHYAQKKREAEAASGEAPLLGAASESAGLGAGSSAPVATGRPTEYGSDADHSVQSV